jgi:hypothetical protein
VKASIPQFFVVEYVRFGPQVRTGWSSHRVPGAGMAYFGFSSRALAEEFAATLGGGNWLPTFVAYPELQAEAGIGQEYAGVKLLVRDPTSFRDPVFHAAPIEAVIAVLVANPAAESGLEADFAPYQNAPT